MGAPHNTARYGETWDPTRIQLCLEELAFIKPFVVLSGGWAWHFMSPVGHEELKHAHDHKDIDVFVDPPLVGTVVGILKGRGFIPVSTKYDRIPSAEDFRRYEKTVIDGRGIRITVDFFVGSPDSKEIDGWKVVHPKTLIGFYSTIHSSRACFAVQAASKLLAAGVDPIGHPSLVAIPA